MKLAEGDTLFLSALAKNLHAPEFEEVLQGESDRLEKELGYDLQTAVIERRWGFLSGVAAEAVRRDLSIAERLSLSDRIDRVVTHRLLGLPLFLGITWLVFTLTYLLGDPARISWTEPSAPSESGWEACSRPWVRLRCPILRDGRRGGAVWAPWWSSFPTFSSSSSSSPR